MVFLLTHFYFLSEKNARKRYVIYSTGEPDKQGKSRPYTVLAMFDYIGNGLVYDHTGKIRLVALILAINETITYYTYLHTHIIKPRQYNYFIPALNIIKQKALY